MTSLSGDVVNRVRRLPKPSSASSAMQPLFEAVSNAMHAIEDAFPDGSAVTQGRITINIEQIKDPSDLTISVADNGVGLGPERFTAFITTDTGFKIERGGKGVGRLLWLDAFEEISVVSIFADNGKLYRRSFEFRLTKSDQLTNEKLDEIDPGSAPTGTVVTFKGLRGDDYRKRFPASPSIVSRHFGSHFLAEFILGNSPKVDLVIGKFSAEFPEDIRKLLIQDKGISNIDTEEFGKLNIHHFFFRSAASAGFDGKHQLHLIANKRTVITRKIDGLLGLGRIGEKKAVYHGCVSGEFLDSRVNQERTAFTFDEKTLESVAKACAAAAEANALNKEAAEYEIERLENLESFLSEYPSFRFSETKELLAKTPKGALKAEQFAQALIPTRIRRDNERRKQVEAIVADLAESDTINTPLAERIREVADSVKAEEQRQLMEYVLRRKVVLDVLEILIRRLRKMDDGAEDYHLESTVHQFICPMKIRGDDPKKVENSDHDLWIIDERLTFATYFASDVPVQKIVADSKNGERPDVLIWDRLHGLGVDSAEPLKRVILVEFKKPGRKDYDDRYNPEGQILRYLKALNSGEIENFNNERVRVAEDCVFYCYIVADIVGNLDTYTSGWQTTADGRGRWRDLQGRYRGSIEVIEWRDLIADARLRNAAFMSAAGVK